MSLEDTAAFQLLAMCTIALGIVMREWGISRASSGFDGDDEGRSPRDTLYAFARGAGPTVSVLGVIGFVVVTASRC